MHRAPLARAENPAAVDEIPPPSRLPSTHPSNHSKENKAPAVRPRLKAFSLSSRQGSCPGEERQGRTVKTVSTGDSKRERTPLPQ